MLSLKGVEKKVGFCIFHKCLVEGNQGTCAEQNGDITIVITAVQYNYWRCRIYMSFSNPAFVKEQPTDLVKFKRLLNRSNESLKKQGYYQILAIGVGMSRIIPG